MRAQVPRSGRRRAVTLVEVMVVLGIFGLLFGVAWSMRSAGARQGRHAENRHDLLGIATVLHEALAWDTRRSVSLNLLPLDLRPRGVERRELVLPLFKSYEGNESDALGYWPVRYVWDPERKTLSRDTGVISLNGVEDVFFLWSEADPTILRVTLVGKGLAGNPGPKITLRIPAPPGTDSAAGFRLARHHRAGRPERELPTAGANVGGVGIAGDLLDVGAVRLLGGDGPPGGESGAPSGPTSGAAPGP